MDVHQELDAPAHRASASTWWWRRATPTSPPSTRSCARRSPTSPIWRSRAPRPRPGCATTPSTSTARQPAASVPFRMLVSRTGARARTDETKTGADGVGSWTFPKRALLASRRAWRCTAKRSRCSARRRITGSASRIRRWSSSWRAIGRSIARGRPPSCASPRLSASGRQLQDRRARGRSTSSCAIPTARTCGTPTSSPAPWARPSTEVKLPDKGLLGVHTMWRRRRACATSRARCVARRRVQAPRIRGHARRAQGARPSTARRASLSGHVKLLLRRRRRRRAGQVQGIAAALHPVVVLAPGAEPEGRDRARRAQDRQGGPVHRRVHGSPRSRHAGVRGSGCSRRQRLHRRGRGARHRRAHHRRRSLAARRCAGDALVGAGRARVLLEQREARRRGQGDEPRGAADRGQRLVGARAAGRAQGQAGGERAAADGAQALPGGRRARGARLGGARRQGAGRAAVAGAAGGRLSRAPVGRRCARDLLVPGCRRQIGRDAARGPAARARQKERVPAGRARRATARGERRVGDLSRRALARLDAGRAPRRRRRQGARGDGADRGQGGRRLHGALHRRGRHGDRRRRRHRAGAAQGQGARGQAGRQARSARARAVGEVDRRGQGQKRARRRRRGARDHLRSLARALRQAVARLGRRAVGRAAGAVGARRQPADRLRHGAAGRRGRGRARAARDFGALQAAADAALLVGGDAVSRLRLCGRRRVREPRRTGRSAAADDGGRADAAAGARQARRGDQGRWLRRRRPRRGQGRRRRNRREEARAAAPARRFAHQHGRDGGVAAERGARRRQGQLRLHRARAADQLARADPRARPRRRGRHRRRHLRHQEAAHGARRDPALLPRGRSLDHHRGGAQRDRPSAVGQRRSRYRRRRQRQARARGARRKVALGARRGPGARPRRRGVRHRGAGEHRDLQDPRARQRRQALGRRGARASDLAVARAAGAVARGGAPRHRQKDHRIRRALALPEG